ncbi:MAG: hypothetical protein U5L05_15800 [Rubrivivax sp.]|nr:hypothetical protein [Rubrivivax sp.]
MNSGTAEHEQNGRDDAQAGSHDIGHALAAAGQQGTCAFGGEVGIDHAHHEYHRGEQHQHLGRVVQEELQRTAQVAGAVDRQGRHQRFGRRRQPLVQQPPHRGSQQQEAPRVFAGQLQRA